MLLLLSGRLLRGRVILMRMILLLRRLLKLLLKLWRDIVPGLLWVSWVLLRRHRRPRRRRMRRIMSPLTLYLQVVKLLLLHWRLLRLVS